MIGIYQILNTINNKKYIGSSIDVKKRLKTHMNNLLENNHVNKYLQDSWNKYGQDCFLFSLIIECSVEYLFFYEDLIIKGYDTLDKSYGYNLRPVGDYPLEQTRKTCSVKAKITKAKNREQYKNKKFGRITLLYELYIDKFQKPIWLGRCDCGIMKQFSLAPVKRGHQISCGCSRIKPEKNQSRRKELRDIWPFM